MTQTPMPTCKRPSPLSSTGVLGPCMSYIPMLLAIACHQRSRPTRQPCCARCCTHISAAGLRPATGAGAPRKSTMITPWLTVGLSSAIFRVTGSRPSSTPTPSTRPGGSHRFLPTGHHSARGTTGREAGMIPIIIDIARNPSALISLNIIHMCAEIEASHPPLALSGRQSHFH